MFGIGNKNFLGDVAQHLSDLGNISLEQAEEFVKGHQGWVLQSKKRTRSDVKATVMDLSSQAMERVDAIYQTESYSELENIPDFFFLISVKVVHLTQDVPGNGAVNKWFVAIQDYPVNPKQTDYTYKNLIQDLLDKEVRDKS
jgi:predicted metal-dependent hydrolase